MSRLVTMSRRVTFSAGHRYWRDDLSADENRALFGRWASPYNHGHNYVLWVRARGPVDPTTGMVVNIKWIDDVLQERVVRALDQRSLNDEVPALAGVSPSLENLMAYLRRTLGDLPGGAELTGLRLDETEDLRAEWTAPSDMLTLTRTYEFAAAHRLHADGLSEEENVRLYGKCHHAAGHGHNYVLEVSVAGVPDPSSGMVCRLEDLDAVVEELVISKYDHKNLDVDIEALRGRPSTSENVASAIFDALVGKVPAKLVKVTLFETARNAFEVAAGE
ncbi:MAG: 6-carboxytetrahydropterin synthase [Fimbriimonadaceae bacterium]|nr:6-carboxytetrahydropterin synthase [Fimbriimonadaceae bacterium]